MRSRWYHKPELHAPSHAGQGKKVSWLELFFDLVFVAGIIQLGDFLSHDVSLGGFLAFVVHFVPLWLAWTGFTFYANRFNVDDLLYRALVMGTMLAVGAMAIASREAIEGDPGMFALSYAAAQMMIALLFLRSYWDVPESRAYSGYWGSMFGIAAVFFTASAWVPAPYTYGMWFVGIGLIVSSSVAPAARALAERYPTDSEHLSERYGLLTIIVLGESFVKVLSYLTGLDDVGPEYMMKGFFNLILTFSIWWIYFDDVADSKVTEEPGSESIWVLAHLPLTLAITAVGVGVKLAIKFDLAEPAQLEYRWLLGGMLALAFVSVAIIDSVTERPNNEVTERNRIYARLVSALLLLLICQVGGTMSSGVFLALIAAICVGQVVFDLMMAPLQDDHQTEKAVSMADMSQDRRARGERQQIHSRGQEVVRLGAPTELRRDFYFFFIEGSWTRTLLSFGFMYVFLNVLFAGLYLLAPGSISIENQSFSQAFFFSVQTISSLGYGGIVPVTDYGNGVATLEVAIGMLFVALATGLMFAKASRPSSAVMFSNRLVVTMRHGRPVLMLRVANARGNEIVDATMTVSALIDEVSDEGHHMRRLHDLPLVRRSSPVFTMSWLAIHEIDDKSVLSSMDFDHLLGVIVTVMGHDGTYGQTTYSRHMYRREDLMAGHRFVDVMSQMPDGRTLLDLGKFHDVEEDPNAMVLLKEIYENH